MDEQTKDQTASRATGAEASGRDSTSDATGRTRPTGETKEFERRDARSDHDPDRMPTADEERRAEQLELDPDVAASYREQAERGANTKGEGRIS